VNNVMVTHCTREVMEEAMHYYNQGITVSAIAQHIGYHRSQMQRYIRLYIDYGPLVFITNAAASFRPKQEKNDDNTNLHSRSKNLQFVGRIS
jgi:transposase-like protein